ncbi:MAG: hypothetical protein SGI74_06645 [Oligoflexia bacterium]|nr:hypothetical protein [Oligoflexia bacterium]
MKTFLVRVFGITILSIGLSACSDSGGGGGVNYMISPNEVSINGCLSLEKLFGRMQGFPQDLKARRYTKDINIDAPGRPRYAAMLTKSNFQFVESEFQKIHEFHGAKQADCATVSIINEANQPDDYQIIAATPTQLDLKQGETKTITLKLLGPQSIEVSKSSQALDMCRIDKPDLINLQFTYLLKWGGTEIATPTESVSTSMLLKMSNAGAPMPASINELVASIDNAPPETAVLANELRDLALTPGNPDEMTCTGISAPAPPPSEEEEDNTLPSPTPEPTPSGAGLSI